MSRKRLLNTKIINLQVEPPTWVCFHREHLLNTSNATHPEPHSGTPLGLPSISHISVLNGPLATKGYFCIPKTMTYFKSFPRAAPHSSVHIGDPNPSRQPAELFALTIPPLSCHSLSVRPMQSSSSTRCASPSPCCQHALALRLHGGPKSYCTEYVQYN